MASTGGDRFRWICLAVAVGFLSLGSWMLNDIRLNVARSAEKVKEAGGTINQDLPAIVAKTKQTADVIQQNLPEVVKKVQATTETVSESLPEIVDRVERTTEVLAELADDIRQLKELAGIASTKRDENLIAYTNGAFKVIAGSGGKIGVKKVVGKGLKNQEDAEPWVAGKRKWALYWVLRVKSKKEMLDKITGGYYIEFPGKEPRPLADWLREHHAETKELGV